MRRDKSHKFIELANKRVNRAIKDLRLVGNLSNRQNYEYTDEQAKKILRALQREVELVRQRFLFNEDADESAFKL